MGRVQRVVLDHGRHARHIRRSSRAVPPHCNLHSVQHVNVAWVRIASTSFDTSGSCCVLALALTLISLMNRFLTELYSRPAIVADTKNYSWPIGRLGFTGNPNYEENQNALHILSQDTWESDRPIRDPTTGKPIAFTTPSQLLTSYFRRMVPHFLGWMPYLTALAVTIHQLEYSKWQLETNTNLRMPYFVNLILYGSYFLFTSFALVQIVFQYLPPGMYWVSCNFQTPTVFCTKRRALTTLCLFPLYAGD